MLKQPVILKPSYLLAIFLLFTHLGALIALISLSLPWFTVLAISILAVISLIHNIRHYALRLNAKAIVKVWLKNNDEWLLQDRQGNVLTARLMQNSYRSLYLVILNFKILESKKKISVIILPDSLTHNEFRQLRSALLFT